MPTYSSKQNTKFYLQEAEITAALKGMQEDGGYKTGPSYNANAVLYPDNQMTFVEKHIAYLKSHPQLDPEHYLANLRLRIKVR